MKDEKIRKAFEEWYKNGSPVTENDKYIDPITQSYFEMYSEIYKSRDAEIEKLKQTCKDNWKKYIKSTTDKAIAHSSEIENLNTLLDMAVETLEDIAEETGHREAVQTLKTIKEKRNV